MEVEPEYHQEKNAYQDSKILYIGNFLRGFNFCWVCDLPEIAKKQKQRKINPTKRLHSIIESLWNSENMTLWKFNTPSKRHVRHNFPMRKILDIR